MVEGQTSKSRHFFQGDPANFPGVGVLLLNPIETYSTCDFPGGRGSVPLPTPLDPPTCDEYQNITVSNYNQLNAKVFEPLHPKVKKVLKLDLSGHMVSIQFVHIKKKKMEVSVRIEPGTSRKQVYTDKKLIAPYIIYM